jgi:hypothetical protein
MDFTVAFGNKSKEGRKEGSSGMIPVPWLAFKSQDRTLPFHPTAAVGLVELRAALQTVITQQGSKCTKWVLLFIGENPPGFAGADCFRADAVLRQLLDQPHQPDGDGGGCGGGGGGGGGGGDGTLGDRFVVLRVNSMVPQSRQELGSSIDGTDPAIPRLVLLGAINIENKGTAPASTAVPLLLGSAPLDMFAQADAADTNAALVLDERRVKGFLDPRRLANVEAEQEQQYKRQQQQSGAGSGLTGGAAAGGTASTTAGSGERARDVIDAVFVVNLPHRTDRRSHMEQELKRQGLLEKTEFVAAVGANYGTKLRPSPSPSLLFPLHVPPVRPLLTSTCLNASP